MWMACSVGKTCHSRPFFSQYARRSMRASFYAPSAPPLDEPLRTSHYPSVVPPTAAPPLPVPRTGVALREPLPKTVEPPLIKRPYSDTLSRGGQRVSSYNAATHPFVHVNSSEHHARHSLSSFGRDDQEHASPPAASHPAMRGLDEDYPSVSVKQRVASWPSRWGTEPSYREIKNYEGERTTPDAIRASSPRGFVTPPRPPPPVPPRRNLPGSQRDPEPPLSYNQNYARNQADLYFTGNPAHLPNPRRSNTVRKPM